MLNPGTISVSSEGYTPATITDWLLAVEHNFTDFFGSALEMTLEGIAHGKTQASALLATYPGLASSVSGDNAWLYDCVAVKGMYVFGGAGNTGASRFCLVIAYADFTQPQYMWTEIYMQSAETGAWTRLCLNSTASKLWSPVLTAIQPFTLVCGSTGTVLPKSGDTRTVKAVVHPTNATRQVKWGGATRITLPPGATTGSYSGLPSTTEINDGQIEAPGYVTGSFTAAAGGADINIVERLVRSDPAGYSRLSVEANVSAVVEIVVDGATAVGIGRTPTSYDVTTGSVVVITAVANGEVQTRELTLDGDTTVTLSFADSAPTDPISPPLPSPADDQNMLIRVHTAMAGSLSYDNDGVLSEDIGPTPTEGLLDIEVAPPNGYPLSLMTGGVITFIPESTEFVGNTSRVAFEPGSSIEVWIGPAKVVVASSDEFEVFWKEEGILDFFPGNGTSMGSTQPDDVSFYTEKSGMLTAVGTYESAQLRIAYQPGMTRTITVDDEFLIHNAVDGVQPLSYLLPVALVAVVVVVAINLVRR